MSDTGDSFGARLDLALKSMNISRIQLAALVGVDKSLVGRWLSSQVVPTAHNLARISETLSKHKPGFNAILWQRPMPEFMTFLGVAEALPSKTAAPEPAPMLGGLRLLSLEMSAREVAANGHVYTGLYVLLRQRFINNGIPVVDVIRIYLDGTELRWEIDDGGNRTQGVGLLLRNKLHLLGESDTGRDGVTLHILNGTGDLHAMVMDGVLASVAGDRFFTPSASKVLLLRIAHPLEDAEADQARFQTASQRVNVINNAGQGWTFVPPKFTKVIDNREPLLRDENADFVLRVASNETVAHSDWDVANYDFPAPELMAAILDTA